MKPYFLLLTCCAVLGSAFCAESGELDPQLEPLKPFLGAWRGEFKRSTPENPVIDVAVWERALNGKAIRVLHSINDGVYGGETLITWDEGKKSLIYHYFTTAGFRTEGIMKVSGKKLECHEKVSGSGAENTREVRATYEIKDDATMESRAKYLKNGEWVPGHEVNYKRSAEAKPVFQ